MERKEKGAATTLWFAVLTVATFILWVLGWRKVCEGRPETESGGARWEEQLAGLEDQSLPEEMPV